MNKILLSLLLSLTLPACQMPPGSTQIPTTTPMSPEMPGSLEAPVLTELTETGVWQQDPLLRQYAEYRLQQPHSIGADGALGRNRESPETVQVGWQRMGLEAIVFGIAVDDRATLQQGLLAFQWAFDRQSSDGRFGRSSYPEIVTFLGAYARSLLLLQQTGYTTEAQTLESYLPQVTRVLNNPDFWQEQSRWEQAEAAEPVTNQLFWAAFCYHLLNLVQPTPRLEAQARQWVETGLARQRSDGSFPEKGGSDTHYQSWSLELLSLYSLYSPAGDRQTLQPHLHLGFQWLASRLLPDGTYDISGNTRTGDNPERAPSGELKQGLTGSPLPYLYWSYLGGGVEARQQGMRVFARSLENGD